MLKRVSIPKQYAFFVSKKAMQKIFTENRDIFFPNSKNVSIEQITFSSIRLGGALKIFIRYVVAVQTARKKEKRILYGIHRFRGASRSEYDILQYFWKNTSKRGGILSFPMNRPIHFFPKQKLILYEELAGKTLGESLRSIPAKKILSFLLPVADLIARLHALGRRAPFVIRHTLVKERVKADAFFKEFQIFFPDQSKEIRALLNTIFYFKKQFIRKFGKSFILIHNDMTLGNVVVQKKTKRLGLIDFSESCTYDPLIDIGTFLSQVDYLGYEKNIHPTDVQKFKQLFIKKYMQRDGKEQKNVTERLNTYQAWGAVQNAIFTLAPAEKKHNTVLAKKFINQAKKYITAI